MNQHIIQKAWLKRFKKGTRNRLVSVSISTLIPRIVDPSKAETVKDFQSEENERLDGKVESKAIEILRQVEQDPQESLSPSELQILQDWVALHLSRTHRTLDDLGQTKVRFDALKPQVSDADRALVTSMNWVGYFERQPTWEYLVLGDHPIVHFQVNKADFLAFPLDPERLIMLSNVDPAGLITPEDIFKSINELSFAYAENNIYYSERHWPDLIRIAKSSRNHSIKVTHQYFHSSP